MDQRSQRIFEERREGILAQVGGLWGVEVDKIVTLGGFESYVFEAPYNGQGHILRLTHSLHRTVEQVEGELDWVRFLAERRVPVAGPVESKAGRLVEVIDLGESFFTAALFEKAPGRRPTAADFGDDFYRTWGEMAGRLHAATRIYVPEKPDGGRYHWYEDPTGDMESYRGVVSDRVIARGEDVIAQIRAFAADSSCYGMIHNDLHPGNFFVDNGRLTAFDFDDCHYAFFANDIAMALFYALRWPGRPGTDSSFTQEFLGRFLEGYTCHTGVTKEWLARIPYFLKLREIDLYCVIIAHLGFQEDGWVGDFLRGRAERIEQNVPVVEVDFVAL